MPLGTPFGDWLAFPHLDGGAGLANAFTIGYRITDDGSDMWTARFNRFKSKDRVAFAGGQRVMLRGIPDLITALDINIGKTIFVPALSSSETHASESGQMAALTRRCAKAVGAGFELNAVSKQPHKPIHDIYNAADREAELDKAGYAATKLSARTIFIFDDFITRGSTQSRIANAIQAVNPDIQVYGVALAKTDRRAFWGTLSNDSVAKKWNELWQQGEQRYRERKAGESK